MQRRGPAIDARRTQRRCHAWRLLIALFTLSMAAAFPTLGKNPRTRYRRVVPLGFGLVKFEDTCISFHASMSADDFFDGLERTETPRGPQFRKNSRILSNFPDDTSVEIWAYVERCSRQELRDLVPASATEFMRSLRFEAKWKRGVEFRSVEKLSIETSPPSWNETGVSPWIFTLMMASKNVPLSDSLVVAVISEDGKKVASFSARL
jgi:hypothetical protein